MRRPRFTPGVVLGLDPGIRQLMIERVLLGPEARSKRRARVERHGETVSPRRQGELPNVARSDVAWPASAAKADELALMRGIDELQLASRSTAQLCRA